MQSSDFGGPFLLHQAVQACCLGDPGMKIALDDDHGLCNEEKRLGSHVISGITRGSLPGGNRLDCTCPCRTLDSPLPSALLPPGPLWNWSLKHWWRKICFNQVLTSIFRLAPGRGRGRAGREGRRTSGQDPSHHPLQAGN